MKDDVWVVWSFQKSDWTEGNRISQFSLSELKRDNIRDDEMAPIDWLNLGHIFSQILFEKYVDNNEEDIIDIFVYSFCESEEDAKEDLKFLESEDKKFIDDLIEAQSEIKARINETYKKN